VIGIDTNILVRFIAHDDPSQFQLAADFLSRLSPQSPGWVSLVTAVEVEWVLSRAYRMKRADILRSYELLLNVNDLVFERLPLLNAALAQYATGQAGLGDHVIALSGQAAGCVATFTFDREAQKSAGMSLLA
jgi:predicted nucleic-acid-binding protein